jgi:AcrR family transcriptional regulator
LTSSAAQSAASRFPGVRPPKPLLPAAVERRLTERQRQLLDALEELVVGGDLADLTMAELAGELNCSLRTLYEISPRKEDLVLAVVDRRLHRIGRAAIAALDETMTPLDALRVYLSAVNEAVQPSTAAFARDFANLPGAKPLLDAHEGYVMAVTRSLLDRAVAKRQIRSVDTVALAHVLGGLGREFSRPDVIPQIAASPKATADSVSEIILRGLASS